MKIIKLKDMPITERPRERLLKVGAENLSSTELLAILIGTGTPGSNVVQVAENIISTYNGQLDRLFGADVQELSKFHGVGKAKAILLKSCFELSKRIHLSQLRNKQDIYFKSSDDIANYFMPVLRFQKQEYLMCVYLNSRGKMLKSETVSMGGIEGSNFYPKEVFKGAISTNAAACALVHNHPSGDPTPSDLDIQASATLIKGGNILRIKIFDHVIIGDGRYCSMKESNLL